MINVCGHANGRLTRLQPERISAADEVAWIDLHNPTKEEEKVVERLLGLQVPTRQEMAEIEESARLYEEQGALVMTAVMIYGIAEGRPSRTQITFVVTPRHLVTVRYADPLPFRTFESKCTRQPELHGSSDRLFISLLESIVERIADVLELVAADLNQVSTALFLENDESRPPARPGTDLQLLLQQLGRKNLTVAIIRESLLSLNRLVPYFQHAAHAWSAEGSPARLKQVDRDVRSLSSYEAQLSADIGFLHQAALGLINLEQNRIIKVFSVAAVLFLPPTLVGTLYGMNFKHMPELEWLFGYPFSIAVMILSAAVPYYWFKRKGWL